MCAVQHGYGVSFDTHCRPSHSRWSRIASHTCEEARRRRRRPNSQARSQGCKPQLELLLAGERRTRYNQPFASASFAASDRFLQPNFWIAFER